MPRFQPSLLAGLALTTALAACSANSIGDRLPEAVGGLPAGAPARPVEANQYPAVHDMPPARPTEPMSEDAQVKLEKELQAARDQQEAREGQSAEGGKPGAGKKAAPVVSKKAVSPSKRPPAEVKKQPDDVIIVPPAGVATKP